MVVRASIGHFVRQVRCARPRSGARFRVAQPTVVAPVLEAICQMQSFTPQGLPAAISLDARLALIRYLYGLGFLSVVDPGRHTSPEW